MRTVLGFLGSTSLLLAGVWLYERKGRTEAALAAVASALSGLYATLLVGTQIYDLIPAAVGLACAGLVGIVGAAIAVRWKSTIVAAIGILGALLAPVLVDAGTSGLSLAFMAIALTAAVGVLLWQRWDWLSLGAFMVSAPQLLTWFAENYDERLPVTLGVLVGFWALYVVAALGYELRARDPGELPIASWLLLLANVVLVAGAGYFALEQTGHPNAAVAWLLGLAAAPHPARGSCAPPGDQPRDRLAARRRRPGPVGVRLRGRPRRPRSRGRLGHAGSRARVPGDPGEQGARPPTARTPSASWSRRAHTSALPSDMCSSSRPRPTRS